MLWGSTKRISHGRKKLSYGGEELLRLFINQKTCFRLVAQESIKNHLHTFPPFPLKEGFDSHGRGTSSSCTQTFIQNGPTSTLD